MKNLGIITMRGWLVLLLVGVSMLLAAQPMQAVPDVATTPVQQGNLPVGPAVAGEGLAQILRPAQCGGIGVAFDGTNVLYTCGGQTKVFMTDLASTNLGSIDTKDSNGNPIELDAIAWDPIENKLWGGSLGGGKCNIYSADMSSGLTTFRFSFNDPTDELTGDFDRCTVTYFDGLTVDTKTNTLYLSGDVSEFISHVDKTGAVLGAPIPFTTLTAGLCPWAGGFGYSGCLNSGLTIGLDGNLFAGTASDGKIMRLDPTVPSLLGQFSTVTGRDEDLECGPLFTKTDGTKVETILSADFNSNKIDVLEAPKGTCVSPTVVKGSISGTKFNDLNNNGGNDSEPGLPGWIITLTDATGFQISTQTGAYGSYSFGGLAPGTYTVAEVPQAGWTQTAPTPIPPGTYTVTITDAGEQVRGKDFGNHQEQVPGVEGRMTGGGSVFTSDNTRVTHGFELKCDATKVPNSLEINWGGGKKFHLESLTSASCTDDPAIMPNPPAAGFDTYKGEGMGRYNGVSGATAKWVFTDAGEPGTNDYATIQVWDSGGSLVLSVSGKLNGGNHQAHKN